jgi:hypothetical protein
MASLKNKLGYGPAAHQLEFEKFLDTKLAVLKENNPQMKDREISEDERTQAKDFFAKIKIYENEYDQNAGNLSKEFRDKVALQVKLQQAQYLARLMSEKMAEKVNSTPRQSGKRRWTSSIAPRRVRISRPWLTSSAKTRATRTRRPARARVAFTPIPRRA